MKSQKITFFPNLLCFIVPDPLRMNGCIYKQTNNQMCVEGVFMYLDFWTSLWSCLVNSKINTPALHHQIPKPPISKNRVCVARGGCFAAVYSLGGMDLSAIENQ